uniref:Radical SAM superfamily enzyme n=1 Tax=Desulfovibrio sp. U5L TaxID=596152 RepID=I2Q7M0_9BACT
MSKTAVTTIINRNLRNFKCSEGWQNARDERYHTYRRNWHAYPTTHHVSDFPLHLDIEITNACNLRCRMCARTLLDATGDLPETGFMEFDFYTRLIDQGVSQGLASVKLNFLGEPLLHPRVADMVAYAKEAGVVEVMCNTNAMLLTPKLSRDLLAAGLDSIFFSVDSIRKKVLEHIRFGSHFETVMGNIQFFLGARQQLRKTTVQVGVNMVLMENNADELDEFLAFWKPQVDRVNWSVDQHKASGSSTQAELARGKTRLEAFCCAQLWQRLVVCVDGTCLPCCLDHRRELAVGDAYTTPIAEIWRHSPRYEVLRRLHGQGRYQDIPACHACPFSLDEEAAC